ncbi:MAG: hypothetical protein E7566_03585 [Ruminococcaceae bacterium]|nr:hypothetical protein [Oscillospiraceae bacterium]
MKKLKGLLSLLLALVLVFASSVTFLAQELPRINFVVLGDSIASGHGLANTHTCYASVISAEKGYYLSNDAVPGHTTDNLLWVVCHSTIARKDIEKADLISISICGNDLIQFLSKADTSVLMDILLNGVNAKAVKEAAEIIKYNLESVCTEIRRLNPDAPIIFQTQYNPLYANNQYSTYAPMAEKLVPVFDDIFDSICKDYRNIFIADVHDAFANYYKEAGSYDVIQSDGIHPSDKGHALIADTILGVIEKLEKDGIVPIAPLFYYMLGDADSNQKITVSDATTIQKTVAGLLALNGDIAKLCLDADQNGSVNIKDATMIQKYIAGLEANANIGTYLPFYE